MLIEKVVAVILAGGKSRRMGRDKMMLKIGDDTLLNSVVSKFKSEFSEVYLSVADSSKYPEIEIEKITDIYTNAGPLAGLHAALCLIENRTEIDGIFLVAADLPFATPADSRIVLEESKGYDICVSIDEYGRFEPLFAYYSKNILPTVSKFLDDGNKRMIDVYPQLNVKKIPSDMLGNRLFYNLNLPEDYEQLFKDK